MTLHPNILLVQSFIPPYRVPFFQRLTESRIFNISFAYGKSYSEDIIQSIAAPQGLRAIRLFNHYFGKKPNALYQGGLLSTIHSGRYNVIIAEFDLKIISNLLSLFYAKYLGIPFIWWGHGIGKRNIRAIVSLRLKLTEMAQGIILYENAQANKFIEWGTPQKKVFVAPNAIDVEKIILLTKNWKEVNRFRILYIGRLIPSKKVDLLIKGFYLAQSKLRPETKLTIIGDGPERSKLEGLAEEYGIREKVEFAGAIYDTASLAQWFNTSWVSVSPGYIGLSAIHSMAFGLPIIVARNEKHSPEKAVLKEKVNTVFFSSDDEMKLAEKIIYLAENQDILQDMAEAARNTVQGHYSLEGMVKGFEQAINYVCSNKS